MSSKTYSNNKTILLTLLNLLVALVTNVNAQTIESPTLTGRWKAINVIDLDRQIGVAHPVSTNIRDVKKVCLNKVFLIRHNKIYIPKVVSKLNGLNDSVSLKDFYRVHVKKDSEQTYRYPGDELSDCSPSQRINCRCSVEKTFMKLLGSKSKTLYVSDGKGLSSDGYQYKVCKVNERLIGLYVVNADLMIMLSKS